MLARTFDLDRGAARVLLVGGQAAWLVPREGRDAGTDRARTLLGDLERGICARLPNAFLRHFVGRLRHLTSHFRRRF